MPTIKEFNDKLSRLRNTQKMTATMKLVAMSKLYKAQEAQRNAKRYALHLTDLIGRLAASVESSVHPLLEPRKEVKKALILVFASDKGLCGGYNNILLRGVDQWIKQNKEKYSAMDISCCGKRAFMHFRRKAQVQKYYEGSTREPNFQTAAQIAEDLSGHFLSKKYDEIYVSYNNFFSPLSQTPMFTKVLPIEASEVLSGGQKISGDYLFEPEKEKLFAFLIPKYLYFRIYFAFLENAAGEHGARMTAMDNATKNADDMIDSYTLLRNRARQSEITTELIEIISGAEALK